MSGAGLEVARALAADVLEGLRPPPALTVSEFSDRELIVPAGPLQGTRWRTDFAPYQRGILDVFEESGVEIAAVMGSSQWGKTSLLLNLVAYHVVHDPCPILVVEPTLIPMAEDFSKNRLDPLIEATPALAERVSKKRAKDASNTRLLKTFRGGLLAIGGANSAASLASRSIRLLALDEIDRYPLELAGEGSTIAVAMKRTTAYRSRRRVILASSPTIVDAPIHAWFLRGDQRRFHVPCPACGVTAPYTWANIRWRDNDPTTARIVCEACGHAMGDAERIEQLQFGEWVAENPGRRDRSIVSFHMWEAYSPLSSLRAIVSGFLAAREKQRAGSPAEMHTFQNTTLGEPVEHDGGDGVEADIVLMRREEYAAAVPAGAAVVTAGIDVQDDRLEALVIAWGPGEESWLVDRHEIPGDTTQPEPWDGLTEVLERTYQHELGDRLPIIAACIDSAGHRTNHVYEYARRMAARRVYATIGRAGDRPFVSSPTRKRLGRAATRKVPLYTVGVDAGKALWMSRLRVTEAGPGRVHVPVAEWADEELAAQLTSERIKTRHHRGRPVRVWVPTRTRNEMLDCAVLGLAALRLANVDLELALARLEAPGAPDPPAPDPGESRGERWIRPRRGWLRRD